MRIKVVKKLFALMVAVAVAITTPGFSSVMAAGKRKHRKVITKKEEDKLEDKKEEDRVEDEWKGMDFILKSSEKFKLECESYIDKTEEAPKNEDILKFGELSTKCIYTEKDKRDFVDVFSDLLTKTSFFEEYKKGDRKKFFAAIELFLKCSKVDGARGRGLQTIGALAQKKLLSDYPAEDVELIAEWIFNCPIDNSIKKDVAGVIATLVRNGFWLKSNNKTAISKVIRILENCLDVDESKKNVVCSIMNLLDEQIINDKNCDHETSSIITILEKCLGSHRTEEGIVYAILGLSAYKLLSNHSGDLEISRIIALIEKCVIVCNAENDIIVKNIAAYAITSLINQNSISENSDPKEIERVVDLIDKCADCKCEKGFVAASLGTLLGKHIIDNYEDKMKILKVLEKCCKNSEDKSVVVGCWGILILNSDFQKLIKENTQLLKPILDLMAQIDNISDFLYEDHIFKVKENVLRIILVIVVHVLENSNQKEEISKIIDILWKHSNSFESKEYVASAIGKLIEKGLLENYKDRKDITKIMLILDECSDCQNAKENVALSISHASANDLLSKYDKNNDISNIMDILKKCSKEKSAKGAVINAIAVLSSKNLFRAYNKKSKMLTLLKECLVDKKYCDQVIDSIEILAHTHSIPWEANATAVFELLEKCMNFGSFEFRIASAIGTLAEKDFFADCSKNDVFKVVDFLEKCLGNEDGEKGVAIAASKLYWNNVLRFYGNRRGIWDLFCALGVCDGIKKVIDANNGKYSLNDLFENYGKKVTLDFDSLKLISKKKCDKNNKKDCSDGFMKASQKIIMGSIEKYLKQENVDNGRVLDILNQLIQEGDGAYQKNAMAYCISNLVENKLINFTPNDISKLLEIFKKCLGSDFSNKFVAKTLEFLVSNNWKDEYSRQQLEKLLKILFDCSINRSSKSCVSKIVDMLILKCFSSQKLIFKDKMTNADQKLILQIINILNNCLYDADENGKFVASSIENLASQGLLNGCEKSKILELVKMLDKCVEKNANFAKSVAGAVWALTKEDSLLLKLVSKDNIETSDKELTSNLLEILDKCSASEPKNVVLAIQSLASQGFLSQKDQDQVLKSIKILTKCCSSKDVETLKTADSIIEDLFTKSFLQPLSSSSQIPKIVKMLFDFSKNGVNKTIIAKLLEKLVENPQFNSENMNRDDMKQISKIYNILNICSDCKDARSIVLKIMHELAKNNILTKKYVFKKENVLKLLNIHKESLSDEDKKSLYGIIDILKDSDWLDKCNEDQVFTFVKIIAEKLDWYLGEIFNPVENASVENLTGNDMPNNL